MGVKISPSFYMENPLSLTSSLFVFVFVFLLLFRCYPGESSCIIFSLSIIHGFPFTNPIFLALLYIVLIFELHRWRGIVLVFMELCLVFYYSAFPCSFQERQLILLKVSFFVFVFGPSSFSFLFVYILDFVKMQYWNHSCYCCTAVSALKDVHRRLIDPFKNLRNWKKKDPCEPGREWTGVICTKDQEDDAYLHVQEL